MADLEALLRKTPAGSMFALWRDGGAHRRRVCVISRIP
jgi:hypothetical protein